MKLVDTTLVHRVLTPERSSADKHPTVIMLHGRGADEEDLLGLSPHLDDRLLIISARAPYPFSFGGGYTWFDIDETGIPEPGMFQSSYDRLISFTEDVLKNYPVDEQRMFLLGFSMGTMMSYVLALTEPHLFRGVIANSGYVPEQTGLVLKWKELSKVDFFIAHGTFDPAIPVDLARRTRDLFQSSNASVTYREYPMGHEISPESLSDIARWLKVRLDGD